MILYESFFQLKKCVSSTLGASPSMDKTIDLVDKKIQQLSSELSVQVKQEVLNCTAGLILKENVKSSLYFLLPVDMTENVSNFKFIDLIYHIQGVPKRCTHTLNLFVLLLDLIREMK